MGEYLSDVKVHSELRRHYWWSGMRSDITRWTYACMVRAVRAPLTPIPVAGPFDRGGVDVIQFPRSYNGNQYAVVFVDYLTSPRPVRYHYCQPPGERDHQSPRSSVSTSIRQGTSVSLSNKKVNRSAYHPQTDGLVESNAGQDGGTRRDGLGSKAVFRPSSPHFSCCTGETLACLLNQSCLDLKEDGVELMVKMSEAWQKKQKDYSNQKGRPPNFRVGERVFLFKPADKTGHARKFAMDFSV